jgi:hypothetical protein
MVTFSVNPRFQNVQGIARSHPRLARIGGRVNRNSKDVRLKIIGNELQVIGLITAPGDVDE